MLDVTSSTICGLSEVHCCYLVLLPLFSFYLSVTGVLLLCLDVFKVAQLQFLIVFIFLGTAFHLGDRKVL